MTIISSVYAKGVKRIQNTILQAITDIINLILMNKSFKSYVNNYVLKMRSPLTQEELDYRANFSDRVNAISSINSLFSDVEDKARRLMILKDLIATLSLGDNINVVLDHEISAAEEAAKKAAEQEEAEANAALEAGELPPEPEAESPEPKGGDEELDLAPMPDSELPAEESFLSNGGSTLLTEDQSLFEDDDDLPTPEEADENRDFTENE